MIDDALRPLERAVAEAPDDLEALERLDRAQQRAAQPRTARDGQVAHLAGVLSDLAARCREKALSETTRIVTNGDVLDAVEDGFSVFEIRERLPLTVDVGYALATAFEAVTDPRRTLLASLENDPLPPAERILDLLRAALLERGHVYSARIWRLTGAERGPVDEVHGIETQEEFERIFGAPGPEPRISVRFRRRRP